LILGYPKSSASPPSSLNELKAGLLDPSFSKQIISQLHALPISESEPRAATSDSSPTAATAPIHAICLDYTDGEANEKWFSKLPHSSVSESEARTSTAPSVAQADSKSLESFFKQIQIVNIVKAPDFGIGRPVSDKGMFSGSIPTARTLSDGLSKGTEQLMTLGFASTAAVWPNHAGMAL
jgi:hypothetical protein